jgi:hypothetical protein
MSFNKIKDIICSQTARQGIRKQLDAALVCEIARKKIKDVYSEEIVKRASPISFKNGVLKIAATNHIVAQEISFQALTFQKQINQNAGAPLVKRIISQVN